MAAIVYFLFASQAQALPFVFTCIADGSQVPSIECRLVPAQPQCDVALVTLADQSQRRPTTSRERAVFFPCTLAPSSLTRIAADETPSGIVDVLATTGMSSTFLSSIAKVPPASGIHAGAPEQILFSLTIHNSDIEVIASMRSETLRVGMREIAIDNGANNALAEESPVARSAALLLISSGIAGVGAMSRRRRGLRRLCEIQAPWTSRKEVSNRTPVTPSLFANRSSHSTPMRI